MDSGELTRYLDEYFSIRDFPDYKGAYNGLQVEGRADVQRVAVAVDVCSAVIDRAVEGGADLLLVHHGLFWGKTAPVTGGYYLRLAGLIKNGLGLYSCHLPLDAHPVVGNNHVLARLLALSPSGMFGKFEGVSIGVVCEESVLRDEFAARIRAALGVEPFIIGAGPERTARIGILTGGGGGLIGEAAAAGIDTYLTGEGAHHTYFDAEELGINVLYAGHYATETVGVRALGEHLHAHFGLDVTFIDHPTGL